jgi:hypothetical protein
VGELSRKFLPFSWLSQPSITFSQGTASTYSLAQHVRNPHGRALTYSVHVGSLPSGVSLAASTGVVSYSGTGGATLSVRWAITDGTHTADSSLVPITIAAAPVGNRPPVWTTVPNINFTVGTAGQVDLNAYAQDPDGDPVEFSLAAGTLPAGTFLSPSGILSYDGSTSPAVTNPIRVDCSEVVLRADLAPIPEIVFVAGFQQTRNMGPFILDVENPYPPGDIENAAGWVPRAGFRPTITGSLPAGVTYNSATAVLSYNGVAAASTQTVQMVIGTESRTFRVRVLQPTMLFGRNALTYPQHPAWTINPVRFEPPTTSFFTALGTAGNGTDASPNVVIILGGTYSTATDGTFNGRPRSYIYLIGEPNNRPFLSDCGMLTWASYTRLYIAGLRTQDTMFTLNTVPENSHTNICVTDMIELERTKYFALTNWDSSNQEWDGGGTTSIIAGSRTMHFWLNDHYLSGGFDADHLHYIHGRPGGVAHWNCIRARGNGGGQTIKTTLARGSVLNCSLWALADLNSPQLGRRAANLIDWVNAAEVVIYNNELLGAFDNTRSTAIGQGTQNGLIFLRARREMLGSDVPAYPNADYTAGTTTALYGGYFPGNTDFTWVQGFDGTTATFKSAAFWAAVGGYDRTNVTSAVASPYAFKHYIAGNKFIWFGGNTPRDAIRNDGTYPRTAEFLGGTSTFRQTHADWVERAVDFLANNTFVGWESVGESSILNYDDAEAGSNGTVTTGVMKWPRTGTPATNPTQYPQYLDIGGNDLANAQIPKVEIPSWFKIGGTNVVSSTLAATAASFTTGFSEPMAVPSLNTRQLRTVNPIALPGGEWPDSSSTSGGPERRGWNWASKASWDSLTDRVVFIGGPHLPSLNEYGSELISVYEEATNNYWIGEKPLGNYSGVHLFDTFAVDVPTRRWFKWTAPYAPSGPYLQPQLIIGSLNFTTKATVDSGATVQRVIRNEIVDVSNIHPDGSVLIDNDTTAPAIDYFPGVGLCFFHKKQIYVIDVDSATASVNVIDYELPVDVTGGGAYAFHNMGHYNPGSDCFVFGGGSYIDTGAANYKWFKLDRNLVVTQLDDSPVVMSVNNNESDKKACACPLPNSTKSVFFHNNGNIYTLDATANTGQQWAVRSNAMDPDNPDFNDRWCVSIPKYNCVMLAHYGDNGTSRLRLYRHP